MSCGTGKVQEISRELGIRYVLQGSVRKDGRRVRIVIQLIDGQPREKVVPAVREFLAGIREALDALPAATPKNAAGR